MKIKFNLSENDYRDFYKFHFSRYKIMKMRPYYGSIMLAIGCFLILWSKEPNFFALLFILYGGYFLLSKQIYTSKALKATKSNPIFNKVIELNITDKEIHWNAGETQGNMVWESFIGYREFEKGFLLYSQSNFFHMIPIKPLTSEEINELATLLKTNLKEMDEHKEKGQLSLHVYYKLLIIVFIIGLLFYFSKGFYQGLTGSP